MYSPVVQIAFHRRLCFCLDICLGCAVEEEIYSSSRTTSIPPMLDGVVCGNECLPCCVGRQLPWYCPSLGKILCLSDSAGRTWGQRMLLEVLICLCGLETPSRSNNLSCVGCPQALFGSIRRDCHICWWWNYSTPQLYLQGVIHHARSILAVGVKHIDALYLDHLCRAVICKVCRWR
jgi:hypothetical protein